MNPRILLCIDRECIHYPAMIGLPDESLENQSWLTCACDAESARRAAREGVEQIWIISCVDMAPINVAAAIKHDNPHACVMLVTAEQDGSLASRASCAHIDFVWDKKMFLQAYKAHKQESLIGSDGGTATYAGGMSYGSALSCATDAQCASDAQRVLDTQHVSNMSCASGVEYVPGIQGVSDMSGVSGIQGVSDTARGRGAGMVVGVVSASGGVGKSTVSTIFAVLAQSCGLKTLLIDGDLQFGDVHDLLGTAQPLRIDDVVTQRNLLLQLERHEQLPAVIAAPVRAEISEIVAPHMKDIIAQAAQEYDVVVVNTGSFWGDVQAQVLEVSDKVLFLLDQRPSSLRSCIHALELCSRMGIASHPFRYAINCFVKTGLISCVDASCALRGAHVDEIEYGGQEVDDVLGAGYPLELIASRNPFVQSMRVIVTDMLSDAFSAQVETLKPQVRRSLFKKWGR